MYLKNKTIPGFEVGELVKHKRSSKAYKDIGIVVHVKQIFRGYDVQVLWPDGRIANHHSNCLEVI